MLGVRVSVESTRRATADDTQRMKVTRRAVSRSGPPRRMVRTIFMKVCLQPADTCAVYYPHASTRSSLCQICIAPCCGRARGDARPWCSPSAVCKVTRVAYAHCRTCEWSPPHRVQARETSRHERAN